MAVLARPFGVYHWRVDLMDSLDQTYDFRFKEYVTERAVGPSTYKRYLEDKIQKRLWI